MLEGSEETTEVQGIINIFQLVRHAVVRHRFARGANVRYLTLGRFPHAEILLWRC